MKTVIRIAYILLFITGLNACTLNQSGDNAEITATNEQQFIAALETHLKAVREKSLELLKSTLQPNGVMHLALPQTVPTTTTKEFLKLHEDWFKENNWTMESKISNSDIGNDLGVALVESIYREKARNGKPYFNRMAVSYTLKKVDGKWYVIRDHASSIQKTEN